ncbi:hypothetical protein ASG83_04265 [Yonghaparkia sp. Soil809]|nr:hypothetical protein ASG83_04265 [Yonghaparkia sp. Soil809]
MDQEGPVTMQTVADALGLSRATVSLALRDASKIAEETRLRVQAEAARLGYIPNRNAVRLRTQQRNVIGLVVPDITNPVVAEAAIGMQMGLEDRSMIVLLSNTFDDLTMQRHVLRQLVEEQVAGVLLLPALGTTAVELERLRAARIPVVLLNRAVPESDLPIVHVLDAEIVGIAFEHLVVEHGAQSLGYFGGIGDAGPRIQRMESFSRLCAAEDVRVMEAWSAPSPSSAIAARELAHRLLGSAEPLPDALIVHNDIIAIGVLRALNEFSISPSELRVVSIDDVELASITTPSLSSVSIHPRDLGRTAGHRLLAALSGGVFDGALEAPSLARRESCGCGSAPVAVG